MKLSKYRNFFFHDFLVAVVLHSRDLTVTEANITQIEYNTENQTAQSTSVIPLPEREFVFLYFDEALLKGKRYILDISFDGTINNQSIGLYRSGYQVKDASEMSWIASSQFQPSDARRVFPCFDEPGMKSIFQAHIIRRKGTPTLSNMPEQKTTQLDDFWEAVTFEVTPRMSTYLLAFVVGDVMPHAENRSKGIQVWSRSDMVQYGEYAYSIAGDMLQFLGDYLEVPYTMPKTDLVAVPRFIHAAMENWGLITFTEAALLYDPERSPTESKVFVTVVIAHELAHQWFGNLVTPTWWEHLWLNEGFASYYQYLCVDALRPEWNISHHFIGSTYEVMETDSLTTTRALSSPVPVDDVLEYFDEIAYIKGGAIIHMVQHFIGERNFRKGLKNYLWKYSYKDVKEIDLWQNLNLWNKNELGVKQIMKTWTNQAGYPVVKIERNYSNRSAKVTQKVFLLEPDELELEEELSVTGDTGKDKRIWYIPISYTDGLERDWSTKTDFWLKSRSDTIKNLTDEKTWFLANIQQVGYYRVNYDIQNWEMLLLQLLDDHTAINTINRAQILNDALNLARSDEVDYSIALNLTKYLFHEVEYLPWLSAFANFRYLDLMLAKTSAHKAWKEYVLTLMSPLYETLGWTDDSEDESISKKYLRKKILKWSCNYGRKDCIKTATLMYSEWKNGTDSNVTMTSDDREVVLCTGIAEGTTEDWEFVWQKFLNETFKVEKNMLLSSLACTRDVNLLEKLLSWVLNTDSGIPFEDGSDVIIYVAQNFEGREVVLNFLRNNADEIMHRFGSFPFAAANMIEKVIAPLNTVNEIKEFENILRRRDSVTKGLRKSVKNALQRAKLNLHWMKHKYEDVFMWLQENPIEE